LQQQSFPITEARVITAATTPQAQSYPKRSLVLALALVFGLTVGGGMGALREYHVRVFRTTAHVRDEMGLEFLGLLQALHIGELPTIAESATDSSGAFQAPEAIQRYAVDHPLSHFSETLRSTKVAVDFAMIDQRSKIVGIISALPHEGKSTVAKNFSSLLAHIGATTLLVDADLRNPGLTRSLARNALAGLIEALRREQPLGDYLLLEPESGLWFLPAVIKKRVLHSSEVIASAAMRALLADAAARFDYVIVDLPPLGPVVDVRAASSQFDAFVFIVEWGRTPRILVQTLLAADEALREKCVGVLYNKVDLKRMTLYESYDVPDYDWYGEEPQKEAV
jgi:succinoglycan biosynthesis transport protein ExoP